MAKYMENQNNYLKNKREKKAQGKLEMEEVLIDFDEDEDTMMLKANPARIRIQEKLLNQLKTLRYGRALEVACSRAHLTNDLLKKRYRKIDMFDADRDKINGVRRKFQLNRKDIQIYIATMENFTWNHKYDGIFIHWCINFLSREKGV